MAPDPAVNRRQPLRQARTNPARTSNPFSRAGADAETSRAGVGGPARQHVDIFPAITAFADAITALPKELVKHFTLLKEVDAKVFAPEAELHSLVQTAMDMPIPDAVLSYRIAESEAAHARAAHQQSGHVPAQPNSFDAVSAIYHRDNLTRRQLFRQCTITMSDMVSSLDEKNHVLSTATEALAKELRRVDELFPHIEKEISEETRWGSMKHWAYSDNRVDKTVERPQRAAPNISREAQLQAEEAAARSDARKQAMLAKKSNRAARAEAEADESNNKRTNGNGISNKSKALEQSGSLVLATASTANGQPAKRRKIEKGPVGGAVMERTASGVAANSATKGKTSDASIKETPLAQPKKRRPPNGPPKKRTAITTTNISPLAGASSPPVPTSVPDIAPPTKKAAPLPNGRPVSVRGRQNSTQSLLSDSRQRPTSAASNKTDGQADLNGVSAATGRSIPEVKATMRESASNDKGEHMIEDNEPPAEQMKGGIVVPSRKDSLLKSEDNIVHTSTATSTSSTSNGNGNINDMAQTLVTTKSGRASKPSTPAIPNFPELIRPRERISRVADSAALANAKRSHKKGAGVIAQQLMAQQANAGYNAAGEEVMGDDEDTTGEENEPTYCFCKQVSYGEMVACDGPTCSREWFHLDCVGLKQAPKSNVKWFCEECKELAKVTKFSRR